MTSKEKGDLAEAAALAYLVGQGHEVLIPFGNRTNYDLVFDDKSKLHRVQCKYAGKQRTAGAGFTATLKVSGGNKSRTGSKKYGDDDFEFLFVLAANGDRYFVPWSAVRARNAISTESLKNFRVDG